MGAKQSQSIHGNFPVLVGTDDSPCRLAAISQWKIYRCGLEQG